MANLYLVATPIGNLEDISLRALRILKEVDAIAAEDTRHSLKLLSHYGINKPLVRLDSYTMGARAQHYLATYPSLAFISDAGTPGISDPGAELVRLALARGDIIEAIPGATAFVPALILSGLRCNRFSFEGFLPRKGKSRRDRLHFIAASELTSCIYESPQRILESLEELLGYCGPQRQVSLSREISKQFESHYRGTLSELIDQVKLLEEKNQLKGELVLVISGKESDPEAEQEVLDEQIQALQAQGLDPKDLRKALIGLGLSRNQAYELSLTNHSE